MCTYKYASSTCILCTKQLFECDEVINTVLGIEVGYTGVKKRVMFQIPQGSISYEAECSPEHFDTFLIKIGQKMRMCRPKNRNWMRGSENHYLYYYFSFVPFFTSVETTDMYVFQVKESILKGFEKIGHFVFLKNVV